VGNETVPGEDLAMFNTAFALGGAQCTIRTVESLTGIYIDHFITVDFNGFKDMVDAVDGVEMCIPKDVDDDERLAAGLCA
jgi:LCP family protein required for cell wall assembly